MRDDDGLRGAKVLLVDDQPANLEVLCELLEGEGCRILMAPDGNTALATAARARPELILLDVMMPGLDGFETCRRLKADADLADTPVVFITARDQTEAVVEGFEAGGVDYIPKPFRDAEVLARVAAHLRLHRLSRELALRNEELAENNRRLEEEIGKRRALKGQLLMISQREAERWGLEGFVGRSPTIQRIFREIRLMQESHTTSVLIVGENGTGKELIARAIHFGGPRAEGPFVPVNCAAMPGELVESLVFGHAKGSFTGADADRTGYYEMADGGTLFLDEIGDMGLGVQAKLLRVLEDGVVRRIGQAEGRKVDVRVLAATNADLDERIRSGSFRQDLYFRLARFTVTAPPLRDRKEDIPLLAAHFLKMFAAEMGREVPEVDPETLEMLKAHSFPGNVRELKNLIERALIESEGGEIRPFHLHFARLGSGSAQTQGGGGGTGHASPGVGAADAGEIPMNLEEAERWLIHRAIAQADGKISEAARLLGTNRNRVYRALAREERA